MQNENTVSPLVDILSRNTGRRVVMKEEKFIFLDDKNEVLEIDIEKAKEELEQEIINFEATKYQRDRQKEYSKLNQDELRFDDEVNGTTIWIDTIKSIKQKYPKPN
ncbi:hypothetical protein [Sulfurimonas sp.]|uniref:hypothetical protein n=1 Tax=Sulfurimonas sp. TaxID=2022749 RepID=UPI0025D4A74F|nr:hypothetical protein [Sulfurimonas sp.]